MFDFSAPPLDEHDDDLESVVQEDAAQETDAFPTAGDELDADQEQSADEEGELTLDEDESEL